jgi:glycosyltransferase involved in cell wall biosynthesis
MTAAPSLLILTAARNEAKHIEATMQSVIAQTLPPRKWIIISDGSDDGTDDRVKSYAEKHDFIQLLRVTGDGDRSFGSKARAINYGYQTLENATYDYVAVLDADVLLPPDYYEAVIHRMRERNITGIGGGVMLDPVNDGYVRQITDTDWSVSGPIQVFTRACWERIGGYLPITGGIDAAAEVMARMHGFTVRAFENITAKHQRETGSEKRRRLGIRLHRGMEDYRLGYHPLFFIARAARRIPERPFLIGTLTMLAGYVAAWLSGKGYNVPDDFVRHLRREQMQRLKQKLTGRAGS